MSGIDPEPRRPGAADRAPEAGATGEVSTTGEVDAKSAGTGEVGELDGWGELDRLLAAVAAGPAPEPPAEAVRRWNAVLADLPPLAPPARGPLGAAAESVRDPSAGRDPAADGLAGAGRAGRPGRVDSTERTDRKGRVGRTSSRLTAPWLGGLAAAAAATALVLVAAAFGYGPAPAGAHAPARTPAGTPPRVAWADPEGLAGGGMALGGAADPAGGHDYGPLSDPVRRAGCLARVGAAGGTALGGRRVDWAGRPAVLLVLPGTRPGRLRAMVVSADCAADSGTLLADRPVGR